MWNLPGPEIEPVSPGRQILIHCAERSGSFLILLSRSFMGCRILKETT